MWYLMPMDTIDIPTGHICAPHEVRDQAKLDRLADSLREDGWAGRPLLVAAEDDCGYSYQAWTGSHRREAAKAAEIETIPCVVLDLELMARIADECGDLSDDDDRLRALITVGAPADAIELMRAEITANKEASNA